MVLQIRLIPQFILMMVLYSNEDKKVKNIKKENLKDLKDLKEEINQEENKDSKQQLS